MCKPSFSPVWETPNRFPNIKRIVSAFFLQNRHSESNTTILVHFKGMPIVMCTVQYMSVVFPPEKNILLWKFYISGFISIAFSCNSYPKVLLSTYVLQFHCKAETKILAGLCLALRLSWSAIETSWNCPKQPHCWRFWSAFWTFT